MKQRLISSIIYFILLLSILVIDIPIVDTIVVVVISLIAMHEYNKAFKSIGYHPISIIGYGGCLSIFLMGLPIDFQLKMLIIRIILPLMLIGLFIYIILTKLKVTVIDVAITVFSLMYIPFMFSFAKLILAMEHSRAIIWFVILGAFMSDIMGFLIGRKFGKRKLCPTISPKKTVEGSIAGIIGVTVSYITLTIILNNYFSFNFNIIIVVLMGIVASIVGQFGDLSASAIKRYCGVKDFGSIMPGHGGILDRCDSIMFVAPIIYIFLKLYLGM